MTHSQPKLTKKQKKALRKQRNTSEAQQPSIGMQIQRFSAKTANQQKVFESYYNGRHLMLHGTAGTGKTFISCYLSLQEILDSDQYHKLIIVRSTEPVRKEGFLPGDDKQKAAVYELPYQAICNELFGRGDAYHLLKTKGKIQFISTAYVRGVTFADCIVLVDEVQNLTASECNTIITRVGSNCKIIFSGDLRQSDLVKGKETSGLADFIKVIKKMNLFDFVEFGPEDIVRSRLIKQYIMIRDSMEDAGEIKKFAC